MDITMPSDSRGERLPVRIDGDVKESARAVAALHGLTLSGLVKNLLQEAINKERAERPELLAEALLKVRQSDKIKRRVAVTSPANVTERKHGKQKPHVKVSQRKTGNR